MHDAAFLSIMQHRWIDTQDVSQTAETMREEVARDRYHEENSAAWDIVARAKYEAEMEEHIEFLRESKGWCN
jgi:hypothetical protein